MAYLKKKKSGIICGVCQETKRRCNVLLWAYAYEVKNHSIVDDHHFDRVCYEIDTNIETGHKVMDKWFKENFKPWTGCWDNMPWKERRKLVACWALNLTKL